jgi:hypothetical protein
MPIKYVNEDKSSGRKDTGKEDKYSNETPEKDYADYTKDYPNDNKEPRKIAKDITDGVIKPRHIGSRSLEVKKQELIAHIQSYQETFNNQQSKAWKNKFKELTEALA